MTTNVQTEECTHEQSLVTRTLALFLMALLTLAIFQSSALVTLTYDLDPSPLNEGIVKAAEAWNSWMQTLGAAGVTESITEWVSQLHDNLVEDW